MRAGEQRAARVWWGSDARAALRRCRRALPLCSPTRPLVAPLTPTARRPSRIWPPRSRFRPSRKQRHESTWPPPLRPPRQARPRRPAALPPPRLRGPLPPPPPRRPPPRAVGVLRATWRCTLSVLPRGSEPCRERAAAVRMHQQVLLPLTTIHSQPTMHPYNTHTHTHTSRCPNKRDVVTTA